MRTFFDTSVLIPVFMEDHEHHERSLRVFLSADRKHASCAAHSLAEVYATMTRMPGRHRLASEQALLFLDDILERITPVALTSDEYHTAIRDAAAEEIVGGTIYDALIAKCALKARAETVYTWNRRHFERFGRKFAELVRTP